jgi:hypothetical protein
MTASKDEELTELKARVAELEARARPPAPFDPGPIQRFDPTEGMSMPASTLREMARAVPDSLIREVAMRDARAPSGPSGQGVIPSSQSMSEVRVGGGGTGWQREVPLGPQPGIAHVDAQLDEADRRDRAVLQSNLDRAELEELKRQTAATNAAIEAWKKSRS